MRLRVSPGHRRLLWSFAVGLAAVTAAVTAAVAAPAHPIASRTATAWTNFVPTQGYLASYTDGGTIITDQISTDAGGDPSHGSANVPPASTDLTSGNPSGTEATCSYGYYDGGTRYNSSDPRSYADDFVTFRMRLKGDPTKGGAFDNYHWNVLLDVDGDGYKEYWLDLNGSLSASGSGVDDYDQLQVLYSNLSSQVIDDKALDDARVDEFRAYNSASYANSFTRLVPCLDGSGDFWLDFQLPLTALKDTYGHQVVLPNSPISFAFSTGASNSDPLQKDWSSDFSGGLPFDPEVDPIRFGDVVTFNGEGRVDFVDASFRPIAVGVVGVTPIYVLVTDVNANTDSAVRERVRVIVSSPTGDDEILWLLETAADSGVFRSVSAATWLAYPPTPTPVPPFPLPTDGVSKADNNGHFYILGGQTATVTYTDANDGDTSGSNAVKKDYLPFVSSADSGVVQFTRSNGFDPGTITFNFAPIVADSDLVYVTVTDANANSDPLTRQTLTVLVESSITGDFVNVSVLETGNNTGVFRNTTGLRTQIAAAVSGDTILQGAAGAILTARYTDSNDGDVPLNTANDVKTDTANVYVSASGLVYLQDSTGVDKDLYVVGSDGIFVTVRDDNNLAPALGYVQVTVTNSSTGDSESLKLYPYPTSGTGVYSNRPSLPTDNSARASFSLISVNPEIVREEVWTVSYLAATNAWSVQGSVSGMQLTSAFAGAPYSSGTGGVTFLITLDDPLVLPAAGENFTFKTHLALTTHELVGTTPVGERNNGILDCGPDSLITATYTDASDGDNLPSNNDKIDTAGARVQRVIIQEVFYNDAVVLNPTVPPTAGTTDVQHAFEWVRLYNPSLANSSPLNGYTIADEDAELVFTIPQFQGTDVILKPGESLYVCLSDGTPSYSALDKQFIFYAGAVYNGALGDSEDQVTLYSPGGMLPANAVDFVAWDVDTDPSLWLDDDDNATWNDIWDELNYVDLATTPQVNFTLQRIALGFDTDQPSDWKTGDLTFVATYVELLSFTARGEGDRVVVRWESGVEVDNVGYQLFRGPGTAGPWEAVGGLTRTRAVSPHGAAYSLEDPVPPRGQMVYYRLESVDRRMQRESFGPVSVDWDADGMEDAFEVAYGLDPGSAADAALDPDQDGLSNHDEYLRGSNPLDPDSDGDGTLDGDEGAGAGIVRTVGSRLPESPGLLVLRQDASEVFLVLNTPMLEVRSRAVVDGVEVVGLGAPGYDHGALDVPGEPALPVKGFLLDVPSGTVPALEVLDVQQVAFGAAVPGPAPRWEVGDDGVARAAYALAPAVYGGRAPYPPAVATVGPVSGQDPRRVARVELCPVGFDPASGLVTQRTRISLRVRFVPAPSPDVASAGAALRAAPWAPPAALAAQVGVKGEGMVRVTGLALRTACGALAGAPLDSLRVFVGGVEVAARVEEPAAPDGLLGDGDALVFHAAAFRSKYAAENVYWVVSDPAGGALRMASRANGATAPVPVASVLSTVRSESDEFRADRAAGAHEDDRWVYGAPFGEFTGGVFPAEFTLDVPSPDLAYYATSGATATLRYRIIPWYGRPDVEPDHWVELSLNGELVTSVTFDGPAPYVGTAHFPGSCLTGLGDKLTANAWRYQAADLDIFDADWFELTYQRLLVAVGDRLAFEQAAGAWRYDVAGFSAGPVTVFDVTEAAAPVVLSDVAVAGAPAQATFVDDRERSAKYVAVGPAGYLSPKWVREYRPSQLVDDASQCDYLVVSVGSFEAALQPLLDHRRGQGLSVRFVDVQSVFDAFNDGVPSPWALRALLAHASSSWAAPAPRYVLLVGDATYDYKNNLGFPDVPEFVPTYLMWSESWGEIPSDAWYAAFGGSLAGSTLAVGRIPARTADEVSAVVEKILGYEAASPPLTQRAATLFVADDGEPLFEHLSERGAAGVAAQGPYGIEKLYLSQFAGLAPGSASALLLPRLDAGLLFANFTGHGAEQYWTDEVVLSNQKVDLNLVGGGNLLPLVCSWACFDGFFADPYPDYADCLAERLLKAPGKGAIACLASSGYTTALAKEGLSQAFRQALFRRTIRCLGDAHRSALDEFLADHADVDLAAYTTVLFGDPALRLSLPAPDPPAALGATRTSTGVELAWSGSLSPSEGGYYVYRAPALGAPGVRLNATPLADLALVDGTASPYETAYYYVTAFNEEGFESGPSAGVLLTAEPRSGSGGGGCQVAAAGATASGPVGLLPLAAAVVLVFVRGRARRGR